MFIQISCGVFFSLKDKIKQNDNKKKGHKETLEVMDIFITLIVVMIPWVHAYV